MHTDQQHKQWIQLMVLTAAHFVLDAFPGLMHTVLPGLQQSFHLSVAAGGILLTAFLVSANGIQVLIGHLRPDRQQPFFLYGGLILVCSILLFTAVPKNSIVLVWLSLIAVLSGLGVGMTHPEALRAVHRLNGISSALGSAVFMAGGVIGFAAGGWGSTHLFKMWGLFSIIPFCAASLGVLVLTLCFRVRLAVESDEASRRAAQSSNLYVSFWLVMAIATLSACSVQVLMWIVPQRLNEIGTDLTVGGVAVSLFSMAGGIGGIIVARWADRYGEIKLIEWMLAVGTPFVGAYLLLADRSWAAGLLCVGGFFCYGAYPLMISAARNSRGPNLGRRMGFIVGGIWLAACLLPMQLGPAAHRFGTGPILFCVPVGFLAAWILAFVSGKR
ncbi:MAG: hypothetical protein KBI46_06815 [Phycisphaerae bacterium]|nr:hypothetical protein [Phycisphaerae bacterium]